MLFRKKIVLLFIAAFMMMGIMSGITAFAADDNIEIVFTDVTATDETTLLGEAKIKVSVKGAGGKVSIAQVALAFESDNMKYKSIEFLKGENKPAAGKALVTPNAALANATGEINTSILSVITPFNFTDEATDLFILTFAGEADNEVTLSLGAGSTYCTVDGKDIEPADEPEITAKGSDKDNEGIEAVVTIVMDALLEGGFTPEGGTTAYQGSDISLKITSDTNKGYTIYTELNNVPVRKGGHRENETTPTFTVSNIVLADHTYTVEISGIGFVTYKKSGVEFDEILVVSNENGDFIPGDIDADGDVDGDDKELCEELIAEDDFLESADFNRDGEIDRFDLAIFDDVESKPKAPSQPAKPTVTTGAGLIKIKWTAPEANGAEIEKYIIKYGNSADELDKSVEAGAKSTDKEINGLEAGKKYYVTVIAVNEIGESEPSEVASVTVITPAKADPPAKMAKPTLTAGTEKITVKWTKPDDDTITKYIIKYGLSEKNLSKSVEVDADKTQKDITGLTGGTKYYVAIAAVNEGGEGELSDTANTTAQKEAGGGGGGGGGGAGGGGGGVGGAVGGAVEPPAVKYYTVTYDIGNGTLVSGSLTEKVADKTKPSHAPTVTAPEGYTFKGWSRNGQDVIFLTDLSVSTNMTVFAIYEKNAAATEGTATEGTATEGTGTAATEEVFVDLGNHTWAKDSIYLLKNKGIINGISATEFAPGNNIKRGDFILILVRMLGLEGEVTENFADVPVTSYYYNAIGIAKAAGIAKGDGENFRPEDTITRQDLITLAYRAFLAKGYIAAAEDRSSLDSFVDKDLIADYAADAMASMVKAGIIKGTDTGGVNPVGNATRAEVAVMCARLTALM